MSSTEKRSQLGACPMIWKLAFSRWKKTRIIKFVGLAIVGMISIVVWTSTSSAVEEEITTVPVKNHCNPFPVQTWFKERFLFVLQMSLLSIFKVCFIFQPTIPPCKRQIDLVYIKTHKTGSSTIANMLYRYIHTDGFFFFFFFFCVHVSDMARREMETSFNGVLFVSQECTEVWYICSALQDHALSVARDSSVSGWLIVKHHQITLKRLCVSILLFLSYPLLWMHSFHEARILPCPLILSEKQWCPKQCLHN